MAAEVHDEVVVQILIYFGCALFYDQLLIHGANCPTHALLILEGPVHHVSAKFILESDVSLHTLVASSTVRRWLPLRPESFLANLLHADGRQLDFLFLSATA